ncbi:MAG: hypothetical protein ACI4EK_07030 [Wujia sp.]
MLERRMSQTGEASYNYIFYVSDFEDVSGAHAWKMDAKQSMIEQLKRYLPNCRVEKYTQYQGELMDAQSVGIIFPSHTWGISLAVYAFLQNLRTREDCYVYAMSIGESLSCDSNETANVRVQSLEQFRHVFEGRGFGSNRDIYIRCIDFKRSFRTTEDRLLCQESIPYRIRDILEGLLFYSVEDIQKHLADSKERRQETKRYPTAKVVRTKDRNTGRKLTMPNLYLDDDLLSEVRICQAM